VSRGIPPGLLAGYNDWLADFFVCFQWYIAAIMILAKNAKTIYPVMWAMRRNNVPTSLFRILKRSMVTRDEWGAGTGRKRM